MTTARTSKMMKYVNWRMRVQISERRTLLGTFMAYDKHLNIVLGDTEEYRVIKGRQGGEDREEKRHLGLVLLRGENVIAISADAPPPPKSRAQQAIQKAGPGKGRAQGRGISTAPLSGAPKGLSGPIRGVGGPSNLVMTPQATISGSAVSYGRGSRMPGRPGGRGARPPPPPSSAGARPPMPFGRGAPPRPPFFAGGRPPMGFPRPPMMGRPPLGRGQ
jgi:small nuclear ribonucleoprotein B and B'